ncbi:hypothetical protein KP509_01G043100 [Ceratopteris richardii]|nr:hypothetical protein KP509_01G043100 [Ceratopteris richardii]
MSCGDQLAQLRLSARGAADSNSHKSSASSSRSFDFRIWEELHLQSLAVSRNAEEPIEADARQLCGDDVEVNGPACQHGFSVLSPSSALDGPGTSLSQLSSLNLHHNDSNRFPQPLSFARSTRGSSVVVINSSVSSHAEQPPVVQVIQTGRMNFSPDEFAMQGVSTNNTIAIAKSRPSQENEISIHRLKLAKESATEERDSKTERMNLDIVNRDRSISFEALTSSKLLQVCPSDVYSASSSPLKSAGCIPFKWEEAPGRPKVSTDQQQISPFPSLQLPPKFQLHSSSINCSRCKVNTSLGGERLAKSASVKNAWRDLVRSGRRSYREGMWKYRLNKSVRSHEGSCSPTSTLFSPDRGLSTSSSTSSTYDAICASPSTISEVQSEQTKSVSMNMDETPCTSSTRANITFFSSKLSPRRDGAAACGIHGVSKFAPSRKHKDVRTIRHMATERMKGFLKACQRWRSSVSGRKRNHEEAEIWEPTLATYFQSMELERSHSEADGQPPLYNRRGLENFRERALSLVAAKIVPSMPSSLESLSHSSSVLADFSMDEPSLTGSHKEDVMLLDKKSDPRDKLITVTSKIRNVKVRRKGRGWVLKKLKNRLKILAALLRVHPNNSTQQNKKCKRRRRLPYQQIIS